MTQSKLKILVTGATGQVGGAVVRRLLEQEEFDVIAAARHPAKLAGVDIPVRDLDFDKIDSLAPALENIDRVFLVTGYTVEMLRQSKVFLDEAKKAGVKHLVHLGACGDDNTTVAHWAWHQLIERYIEWCRFTFTHLRPEGFMQNLLGYGGTRTILDGTIKQYYGGARISWVDCDDVAEVAVCALTDTERHNGQTYRLGYDAKSFYEIADILTEVIGQPFSYDERSPDEFWQGVLSSGAEPTYMRSVYEQQFDYPAGKVPGSEQTYDNFEPITGKKPVDWYEFARKHAAEFRY